MMDPNNDIIDRRQAKLQKNLAYVVLVVMVCQINPKAKEFRFFLVALGYEW